jgi:membrane protein DedA with SNARE-associated domain
MNSRRIPWELIMPLAGFTAARGELSFVVVVLAGMAGSVAEALPWYFVGRRLGCERLKHLDARHDHCLILTLGNVETAADWFRRHSGTTLLVGRSAPGIRTLISVSAGTTRMALNRIVIGHMPHAPFS